MTQAKSYGLLAASVVVAGLIGCGLGWLLFFTGGVGDRMSYAWAIGAMSAPFGALYWSVAFEPPVVPPAKTVGWRRFRPLMWWAALSASFYALLVARFADVSWGSLSGEVLWSSVGMGGFFMLAGWMFGANRADRARFIAGAEKRQALAKRLIEAFLELCKSDPHGLGLDELKPFVQEPYGALSLLSRNRILNRADLFYIRGVVRGTSVPETVNDKPVAAEYAMVLTAIESLATDAPVSEDVATLVGFLETRAAKLRNDRLAKKL